MTLEMTETWQELVDDEGNTYYYNPSTEETSWTKPEHVEESFEWEEFTTDEGEKYYYNPQTQETTWERPTGPLKPAESDEQKDIEQYEELQTENPYKDLEELLKNKPIVPENILPEHEPKEEPKKLSPEEAAQKFKKLLGENGVDSTWSLQDIMARFVTNPSYWVVEDGLERKRLYEEFLIDEMKREMSDKTNAKEKFTTNFLLVLQSYREKNQLNHNTRWFSIKNRLLSEENPIFKHAVLSDGEIYEIFREFQEELKNRHETEVKQRKEQALSELEVYLTKVNPSLVSGSDDWENLYEKLVNDNRFKANKHFNALHKLDMLELYSDKILPEEIKRLEDQAKVLDQRNYRSDRKARDKFKQLLNEMPIQANTLFEEILPIIEDEDAFIDLCGRNGSTPVELFWNLIREKLQLLKVKTDLVESTIKSLGNSNEKFLYKNLLTDKQHFLQELSTVEDERLKGFKQEGEELEIIYDTIKRNYEMQQQQRINSCIEEVKKGKSNLCFWFLNNYNTVPLFQIVDDKDTIAPERICITKQVSNDINNYTLKEFDMDKVFPELEQVLSSVESYTKLKQVLQELAEVDETLKVDVASTIKDSIEEFIEKLNGAEVKRSQNKRRVDDEARSQREEVPKKRKPMVLNY